MSVKIFLRTKLTVTAVHITPSVLAGTDTPKNKVGIILDSLVFETIGSQPCTVDRSHHLLNFINIDFDAETLADLIDYSFCTAVLFETLNKIRYEVFIL